MVGQPWPKLTDPENNLTGGAYSLEFDNEHNLVGYKKVLGDTAKNCHGGETRWGSWVSCEENKDHGRCWQGESRGILMYGLWH